MANLDRALAIAVRVHRNQKDKSGRPYILHPLRIMMRMTTEEEMIVAVLHDVIEDSDTTIADLLKENFSPAIITAVDLLTRREHEGYEDYVARIKGNPLAIKIKLADLEDNMDMSRLRTVEPKDLDRLARYKKAYAFLTEQGR